MGKKSFSLVLVAVLLAVLVPVVSAQDYSGFDRFADDVRFFFSDDNGRVRLALEIREKEVNSALENFESGNIESAVKSLENAKNKLGVVQEKVSLETSEEVKNSVEKVSEKILGANFPKELEEYAKEEEKTRLTAELTLKNFEYCLALAQNDYALFLKEEKCNPATAPKGMEKELKELKQVQEKSFNEFMLDIRSCIDDPGTCDCSYNSDTLQKSKCEKMVALAVKCEYKDDEASCNELDSMKPVEGDGFAESFFPDFLMGLFNTKEQGVIEYDIEKSDVPEECYNENEKAKPQCAAFRDKKELSEKCWDESGNFLVDECGGPKESTPTMQESIPQCYDPQGNFLKEKCGKVTIIWNEEGLINYITENKIDEIVDKFEIDSEQHKIEVNGKEGQTLINDLKNDIEGIEGQIEKKTFAPGTKDTGKNGEMGPEIKTDVANGDDGLEPEVKTGVANGDDGLKPEVKTGGASNGDNGLEREVKTYSQGDGTDKNNEVREGNPNEVVYDSSITSAPGDTIVDPDGEPTNNIDP